MRLDKLTTKFQEALGDAQTLALTHDNPYIEPAHLLLAMLRQDDGPRALLERAAVNLGALEPALERAIEQLPQVQGGEGVQAGRDLIALLQASEKEALKRSDPYVASEMFLLALSRDRATASRRPFTLYIDECADFVTDDVEHMLDETRKFGLHVVLSHQRLSQLKRRSDRVHDAVLGGTHTKVIFGGLMDEDAERMAREVFRPACW